jgi:hypothetical protein
MTKIVRCPYCGDLAQLVDSAVVYNGRSYGLIYLCQPCGAWVGCHKDTNKPLGRLADAELRQWKQRAHRAFDPIWKNKSKRRPNAYKWLAKELNIEPQDCHIGMFDVDQCKQVVDVCARYRGADAS